MMVVFWRLHHARIFIIPTVWTENKKCSHLEDGENKFYKVEQVLQNRTSFKK